jgi:phage host-nuclease inhibitor protein Gam
MDTADTEQDVLHHLLEVESAASVLVNDAQTEADRRVTEGEKKCRAAYDEQYSREVRALDLQYEKEIASIKADYNSQLASYREGLALMPRQEEAFCRLAESLLIREG